MDGYRLYYIIIINYEIRWIQLRVCESTMSTIPNPIESIKNNRWKQNTYKTIEK